MDIQEIHSGNPCAWWLRKEKHAQKLFEKDISTLEVIYWKVYSFNNDIFLDSSL